MEVSGKFRAGRHDVARTGCISAYVASPQFDFDSMEMWPLQERLASCFTTLAIDWVGFGDRPRPPLRWSPKFSELSGVSADRRCASAICNNRRRTCGSLLSGRCRGAARLDRASLPNCSNMARTIADYDGETTPCLPKSVASLIGR